MKGNIKKLENQLLIEDGRSILYDLYLPEEKEISKIIIFAHGYKGFKDWGAWSLMGEEIAKNGIAFLKFNFSLNGGMLENPIDFPDEDAFGRNTYSQEMEDLNIVLDAIPELSKTYPVLENVEKIPMGHSRGGAIVSYVSSTRPDIYHMITLASVSRFDRPFRMSEEALKEWKDKGVMYVQNARTKQELPHYYSFFEDFLAHQEEWNLEKAFKDSVLNHLIIHGDKDEAVSLEEAKELHAWNAMSDLKIIENTGHTFGAKHPWEEQELPKALQEVVGAIIAYLS